MIIKLFSTKKFSWWNFFAYQKNFLVIEKIKKNFIKNSMNKKIFTTLKKILSGFLIFSLISFLLIFVKENSFASNKIQIS